MLFGTNQASVPYVALFGAIADSVENNQTLAVTNEETTATFQDYTAVTLGDCMEGSPGLVGVGIAFVDDTIPSELGTGSATVTLTVMPQ